MNNEIIKKWRTLAMLENIKNRLINKANTNEEIIQIIDNYINFVKKIKDDEINLGRNNMNTKLTVITIPYPKHCSECQLYDDRGDYPTCFATQTSQGYKFNIFEKKMSNCPLRKLIIEP